MLPASPLPAGHDPVGKLLSSLVLPGDPDLSSLPLMILCYLLGGLLLSEITRSYLVLILAAGTFGLLTRRLLELLPPHQSALVRRVTW